MTNWLSPRARCQSMLPPSLLRKRIFANLHQIPQLPATISWNSMHCYQVNPYWGTLVSSCIKWSLYLYMWSEIWLTCSGMIASFNAKEVSKRIGNSAMSVSTILDEGGDDFTQLVTASHHRHAPCMVTCDNHRSSALRALSLTNVEPCGWLDWVGQMLEWTPTIWLCSDTYLGILPFSGRLLVDIFVVKRRQNWSKFPLFCIKVRGGTGSLFLIFPCKDNFCPCYPC